MKKIKINEGYLDTTGIVHEKELLSNILNQEVEFGSNNNGRYMKFPNGLLICTKDVNVNASTSLWVGNFYHVDISCGNWAYTFSDIYYVNAISRATNYWVLTIRNFTGTDGGKITIVNPHNQTSTITGKISVIAIGKWK